MKLMFSSFIKLVLDKRTFLSFKRIKYSTSIKCRATFEDEGSVTRGKIIAKKKIFTKLTIRIHQNKTRLDIRYANSKLKTILQREIV
jgi:hypothetical protein